MYLQNQLLSLTFVLAHMSSNVGPADRFLTLWTYLLVRGALTVIKSSNWHGVKGILAVIV